MVVTGYRYTLDPVENVNPIGMSIPILEIIAAKKVSKDLKQSFAETVVKHTF